MSHNTFNRLSISLYHIGGTVFHVHLSCFLTRPSDQPLMPWEPSHGRLHRPGILTKRRDLAERSYTLSLVCDDLQLCSLVDPALNSKNESEEPIRWTFQQKKDLICALIGELFHFVGDSFTRCLANNPQHAIKGNRGILLHTLYGARLADILRDIGCAAIYRSSLLKPKFCLR
jgi:hypothetical protein